MNSGNVGSYNVSYAKIPPQNDSLFNRLTACQDAVLTLEQQCAIYTNNPRELKPQAYKAINQSITKISQTIQTLGRHGQIDPKVLNVLQNRVDAIQRGIAMILVEGPEGR